MPYLLWQRSGIPVRDPLCVYEKDPAEQIADRLERAECIGRSGMFLSYSGWYKGAHVTVVSGGSAPPDLFRIRTAGPGR